LQIAENKSNKYTVGIKSDVTILLFIEVLSGFLASLVDDIEKA
jgi:hypothetical protein